MPSWQREEGWSAFQIERSEVEKFQMRGIDGGNELPKRGGSGIRESCQVWRFDNFVSFQK